MVNENAIPMLLSWGIFGFGVIVYSVVFYLKRKKKNEEMATRKRNKYKDADGIKLEHVPEK